MSALKEEEKLNTELWEARFNLAIRQKATNTRYACEEYSSPCPACGGSDRVSVFQGVGKIVARCWGTDQGRSGCGKIWYRDQFQRVDLRERNKTVQEESATRTASSQEHKQLIEEAHQAIFTKEFQAVLSYAKERGFTEETIKKFQIGAIQKGNKKGLLLPVFKPNLYYQTRWIDWNKCSPYPKYQNPTGPKPTHALFSEGSESCLVFESLMDAMLLHAYTGYSTLAAMGACLKDQVLNAFKWVYLVPDQDQAGERCFGLLGKYERISLPSDYKDIGELILKKNAGVAKYLIEKLVSSKQAKLAVPKLSQKEDCVEKIRREGLIKISQKREAPYSLNH